MKIKLALFVICLITSVGFSQTQEIRDQPLDQVAYLVNSKNPKYESVEGSPYLNVAFLPAKINGSKQTKLVRFNVVDNAIEVMIDSTKVLILKKSDSNTIKLLDGSNKEYQSLSYKNDAGSNDKSFFELVHSRNNYRLYLKERIKYIESVKNKSPYQEDSSAKFLKVRDVFYITNFLSSSPDLIEIPKKKKQFINLFKDRSLGIQKFIKKEKLDHEDMNDLVEIFDYYFG